jgi:hypothetical protein
LRGALSIGYSVGFLKDLLCGVLRELGLVGREVRVEYFHEVRIVLVRR